MLWFSLWLPPAELLQLELSACDPLLDLPVLWLSALLLAALAELLHPVLSAYVFALFALAKPLLAVAPLGVVAPMFMAANIGFNPAFFKSATAL